MSIKVEKTDKTNELKLTFTVEAEKFDEGMKTVYKKTAKYFSIPGFRKGKAPMSIIERTYGSSIFYEDTFNEIVPEIYEKELKENNIDLNDLTIDTSVDFASMAGTFISGVGDFVTLFEPSATQVEQKGYGYVVGYIGEYGGSVPYTAYNARKSYISENKDTIQKFTNAINKGLDFVWNNDEETVAKVIVNQFPDLTINELSKMIKRYKDNDAWMKNTYFTEESFDHLQDIMIEAGELKTKVPYKDLVDTSFSKSE